MPRSEKFMMKNTRAHKAPHTMKTTALAFVTWLGLLSGTHAWCALPVNQGESAFEYADAIAHMSPDDSELQALRSVFLSCVQRVFDDGETLLHSPYVHRFCTTVASIETIEIALCRTIGGNPDFFESVLLQQDEWGNTPFHAAVWYGYDDWLQMLIRVALDCASTCSVALVEEILIIKNQSGESVFDLARAMIEKFTAQHDPLRALSCTSMFVSLIQFRQELQEKSQDLYS
jgi:hypothetical protein